MSDRRLVKPTPIVIDSKYIAVGIVTGTLDEIKTYTLENGVLAYATDTKTLHIGDDYTEGGIQVTFSNIDWSNINNAPTNLAELDESANNTINNLGSVATLNEIDLSSAVVINKNISLLTNDKGYLDGEDKTALEGQIDNKIESWIQSTDPSQSWSTTEEKNKHVKDVWYSTTNKKLYLYKSDHTWETVEDQKALDAFVLAEKKSTLYYQAVAPSNPDTDDGWFDTTDKLLKIYTGSSWLAIATKNEYFYQASSPINPTKGDFWQDSTDNQLYMYDGSVWKAGKSGQDGADATERYVWVKYADDEVGNGLSDYATNKTHMGVAYNKTTPTESTNPSDYTWSKIKGDQGNSAYQTWLDQGNTGTEHDFISTLKSNEIEWSTSSDIVIENSNKTIKAPTLGAWNKSAWSNNYYKDGAYLSFTFGQIDHLMCGFSTNPSIDNYYTNISFAFYGTTTSIHIYESGIQRGQVAGSYDTNTKLELTYTDGNIKYTIDGSVVREVQAGEGLKLYVDSSFSGVTPNATINNIIFTSLMRGKLDIDATNKEVTEILDTIGVKHSFPIEVNPGATIDDDGYGWLLDNSPDLRSQGGFLQKQSSLDYKKVRFNHFTYTHPTPLSSYLAPNMIYGSGTVTLSFSAINSIGDTGHVLGYTNYELNLGEIAFENVSSSSFAPASHSHSNYIPYSTAGSYPYIASGNWLRVAADRGIIPYTDSTCHLGTSSWQFLAMHAVAIYENNVPLASKYAPLSHSHSTSSVLDTRSTNTATDLGDRQVRHEFKANSTDGLNDGGTYHGVTTFQQWGDHTGGSIHQLAFTNNKNLWLRNAPISGSWGSWVKMIHSGNINEYIISGGSLTEIYRNASGMNNSSNSNYISISGLGAGYYVFEIMLANVSSFEVVYVPSTDFTWYNYDTAIPLRHVVPAPDTYNVSYFSLYLKYPNANMRVKPNRTAQHPTYGYYYLVGVWKVA